MHDPYTYGETDVLINKQNIKNLKIFEEMEAEYTGMRLREIAVRPLKGNYDFEHFCKIHQYIFQDIFDWAGETRTVNIEKPEDVLGGISIEYTDVKEIQSLAEITITKMTSVEWENLNIDEKAKQFSKYLAALWKIHCFREGNTRTVVHFCCQYADHIKMPLDRSIFEHNSLYFRNALVAATAVFSDLGDKSNLEYLIKIVRDALEKGTK
ncbi:hypothetical protein MmiAt1_10140 [Methanimicrococcus sp. At1]|uniref:Fido domain-containing protein n=1 Tax=Methanimicrococcus hacksteinii TaxID=3028293 RepID=A0ABU3VPX6_9EURY|nr:Fic family protein [Methanimicrococcus sp. At1]MDV0445436.1 hypothetical protein [Methanimicrococcus sp. At1]